MSYDDSPNKKQYLLKMCKDTISSLPNFVYDELRITQTSKNPQTSTLPVTQTLKKKQTSTIYRPQKNPESTITQTVGGVIFHSEPQLPITYDNYIDFIFANKKKNSAFTPNLKIINDSFKQLYVKLINVIITNHTYTQKFYTTPDSIKPTHESIPITNTHINIAALMFLNFMLEIELFVNFYNNFKYNTVSNRKNNKYTSIFNIDLPLIYQDKLEKSKCITILDLFANKMDSNFNLFCIDLINELRKELSKIDSKFDKNAIYKLIVPSYDYRINVTDYNTSDKTKKNMFEFIYHDWKNNIYTKIKEIKPSYDIDLFKKNNILNKCVHTSLVNIRRDYYIYEYDSSGMFSGMFINHTTNDKFYNNCISETLTDLYFLSRLHINENNIGLIMQSYIKTDKKDIVTGDNLAVINILKKYGDSLFDEVKQTLIETGPATKTLDAKLFANVNIGINKNIIFYPTHYVTYWKYSNLRQIRTTNYYTNDPLPFNVNKKNISLIMSLAIIDSYILLTHDNNIKNGSSKIYFDIAEFLKTNLK